MVCLFVAALGAWVPALVAQNALYVEYEGKLHLVRGVDGTRPVIELEGKRVAVRASGMTLQPIEEYVPELVAIRDIEVKTSGVVGSSGAVAHKQFSFRASFVTEYRLNDVFVVLDLHTEKAGSILFLSDISPMYPRQPVPIWARAPLNDWWGSGKFVAHVMIGGIETFNSEMSLQDRESALDRMVAKRIAKVVDQPPLRFVGPEPAYPKQLWKSKATGQAVISVRVGTDGRPLDPSVKSASDPAFGAAALAAVREWRFLPQVKDGRPCEAAAEIPFDFAPPAAAPK